MSTSTAGAGDIHTTSTNHGGPAISPSTKRRTCTKGGIRKNTPLDGVVVEEPFTFEGGEEGCYVSCTVQSKRYYGVLVDQNALTTASRLVLKNEAESLNLNRRIKHLYNQQQQQQETAIVETNNKKSIGHKKDHRQVQKFVFLPPPENESGPGYRTLLATYANVRAAAEDDDDKYKRIWSACESGGNFVDQYYYQFFVSTIIYIHKYITW